MEYINIYTGEVREGYSHTAEEIPLKPTCEKEDHRTMTEQAYVPPEIQINDMILAGLRLDAERRARFDSTELEIPEGEDIPLDPTREPGVDLVDIQRHSERVRSELEKAQTAENKRIKEEQAAAYKAQLEKMIEEQIALRKGTV